MSDSEKARITEAFRIFQIASSKCVDASLERIFYTAIALSLGWVLEEPVYREGLQEHIQRLNSMGVEPSLSDISKN